MATPIDVPSTISAPTFPEDIERAIIHALLNDARDMGGTMSLVDSRFYAWTKPARFHTVVIRHTHIDWQTRIRDLFLPNARFIRVLAIELPSRGYGPFTDVRQARGPLSDAELSHIRRLLETSDRVRHLAVDWNLWARFHVECGALRLDSLYLIWDRALPTRTPSLENLQHPTTLNDLTIYAPPNYHNPCQFRHYAENFFFPEVAHCVNLAYVTYATDRPSPLFTWVCRGLPHLKGFMFVEVAKWAKEEKEGHMIKRAKKLYANFSTAYLLSPSSALEQWLAKVEGRPSVLEHPPPRAVE